MVASGEQELENLRREIARLQQRVKELEAELAAGGSEAVERKQLQEQMLHAQKLESLGVLAGGIAHDFNNLLCGMLGSADLALFDLEPAHPARDSLEMVRDTAQRATELCRQMLAYSGKGRFEVEPLDVSRLIGDMAQLLRVSVAKKASLRLELQPDLPTVAADPTQLRQILLNLVVNASDSLGGGSGSITVATGATQCDRGYLRSAYLNEDLPEGRYVFIEVADTGCGMDEETRLRIFDPFFTTKFIGRGLGLAATLGIVRGHNGTVKVYSEPRVGTTFKVLLPAITPSAVRSRSTAVAAQWRGHGVVLLVDDERTVRTIGAKMLERLGFEVLLAEDGLVGVEKYRDHAGRIDVVILDMTMPGLSGEEAFGELRKIRSDVRVLLTSGYNEQEATNRFIGKGLAGFLQKPFQLTTLREKLCQILDRGTEPE
jgi:signal transduction histidine kinase/CheY-like chemotaxis protein